MRFFAELVLRFGGLKLKRRIFSQIGETFHNGKEAFCISFSLFIFDHLTETIPMLFQQFNAFKKIALWQVYHSTFIRKKLDLTQYYSILTLFYNFNSKSDILIFAFEYSDKRNLRITFFITPKLDHQEEHSSFQSFLGSVLLFSHNASSSLPPPPLPNRPQSHQR